MLKQLRFDGYKLIHCRMLWIVYAVSFAMMLVIPIQEAIRKDAVLDVWEGMSSGFFLQICVVLFVAFFVGADYRSGYIKTVISRVEWTKYVLSKVLYVFVFCMLWMFVYHLLLLAIVSMGGGGFFGKILKWEGDGTGVYEKAKYNFGLLYCKLLWEGLSAFAYGMLVMFVLMASKSTIAALVCGLVYHFVVPSMLYPEINSLLINSFHVKEQMYIIEKYTVSSGYWIIDTCLGQSSSELKATTGDYLLYHFGILFYTLLSVGFSILICYKRKRKN